MLGLDFYATAESGTRQGTDSRVHFAMPRENRKPQRTRRATKEILRSAVLLCVPLCPLWLNSSYSTSNSAVRGFDLFPAESTACRATRYDPGSRVATGSLRPNAIT